MKTKIPLAGLLPEALVTQLSLVPAFRGEQLFKWIQDGAADFSAMSNIPRELKDELVQSATLRSSIVEQVLTDTDGTSKFRIKLHDGLAIEAVMLSDPSARKTACVSSQAGCGMGCVFCKTATMGLKRNLGAYEIVEQYLHLKSNSRELSNIVFMGMGEPLLNLASVRKAIEILHHPKGNNIGLRKMTISTCGIVAGIRELAEKGPYTRLAFSLTTADQTLRSKLMPVSKTNPLHLVKKALLDYQSKSRQRVTIEVVLMKNVNDRREDMEAIAGFLPPLDADVNIIPWNSATGLCYSRPDNERIKWFMDSLEHKGIHVIQRFQKGDGIRGACGQLAVE
jgi:23S rRNA (adenine2503-C2)-methyltransferase